MALVYSPPFIQVSTGLSKWRIIYDHACNFWCPLGKYSWSPFVPNFNDIPSCVSTSSVLLYADDKKYFNSIKYSSGAASLQDDVSSVSKW